MKSLGGNGSKMASTTNTETIKGGDTSQTSQMIAINMLPTSQPNFGTTAATSSSYSRSYTGTHGHSSVKNVRE